jgi:AP-3 complex subunit delta
VTTPTPEQVVDSLFTPKLSSLSPRVTALFVHNGAKVFARWASSLSENWNDSELPAVKRVVQNMVERLQELTANRGDDIEVFERVRVPLVVSLDSVGLTRSMFISPQSSELLGLLRPILTDLDVPRPNASTPSFAAGYDDLADEPGSFASSSFHNDSRSSWTRVAPSSLTLLEPMFFSYELNPVNPKAQGMVAAPEGLDLDAWIVPRTNGGFGGAQDEEEGGTEFDVDEYGRPKYAEADTTAAVDHEEVPKKKKGTKGKKSRRKARVGGDEGELDEGETTRVSEWDLPNLEFKLIVSSFWLFPIQRRAERLEQQRDDPYYVSSKAQAKTRAVDEIEAIPVIKLDLADLRSPPPQGGESTRSRQSERRPPTPPPAFVEVEGEMPTGVPLKQKAVSPPLVKTEGNGEVVASADTAVASSTARLVPLTGADELETSATEAVGIKKVVKKRKDKDSSKTKKKTPGSMSTPETR